MSLLDLLYEKISITRLTPDVLDVTGFTTSASKAPSRQPKFKGKPLINIKAFTTLDQFRVVGSLVGVSQSETLSVGGAIGSCQFFKNYDALMAFESSGTVADVSVSWVTPAGAFIYQDKTLIGPNTAARVVNRRIPEWTMKNPGPISDDIYTVIIGSSNNTVRNGDIVNWSGDKLQIRSVHSVIAGGTVSHINLTAHLIPR